MITKIYLTIDDAPSMHMDKKVSFLKERNIPAIFYVRGEYVEKHCSRVVNAINNGFLIGNHSYSHPYFSQITLEQCFQEILRTEQLIDQCYDVAQKRRPLKIVRLPFGDRGAGPNAKIAKDNHEEMRVQAIQNFLCTQNFTSINFYGAADGFIDSYWDWDTEDYKAKHIADVNLYLNKMQDFFDSYTTDTAVILLHDFDNNQHLFEVSMEFLLSKRIHFLSCQEINSL